MRTDDQNRPSQYPDCKGTQKIILEAAVTAGIDDAALMKLEILENAISQGEYEANVDVPIVMNDSEKTQSSNEWLTYRERNDN